MFKEALTEVSVATLGKIGGEMRRLMADPGHIDTVLRHGAERAAAIAIPILREVQDITAEEAAGYIFGYVCLNDVSDRSTQVDAQKQIHLVRAKSRPTYCPIGPYLTTGINPMDLDVWTKVNGHYEQQGNTSDMLFPVYEMLAYFSRHIRMVPGDILATGTPSGVGLAKNRFMAVGDILECGITNLGAQRHEIVA